MLPLPLGRQGLLVMLAAIGGLYLLYEILELSGFEIQDRISHVLLPARPVVNVPDAHPITTLMKEADDKWEAYEESRSSSFREVVDTYRRKYGRHPPPGFKEWYKYARERKVWSVDDFDQIMDDLRPFWAVEPKVIRTLAAHMWENFAHGAQGIHVRNHAVVKVNLPTWRSETIEKCISNFIEYLPDMDIAINRLDEPRLLVPWEEMQEMLAKEHENRAIPPEALYEFTSAQQGLLNLNLAEGEIDDSPREDGGWYDRPGRQYMEVVSKACPPDSPARSPSTLPESADALYKEPIGGLISNFNLSSDLCTIGPVVQNLHGFLYSTGALIVSHKLVPIFSECKVSVNNDILFPAIVYYMHDDTYEYTPNNDPEWNDKSDTVMWRGKTTGGVQNEENYERMHRQRLVQLLNGTYVATKGKTVGALTQDSESIVQRKSNATYEKFPDFAPGSFATEHTDVGFAQFGGCVPDCDTLYNSVFSLKPKSTFMNQFRSRYLVDVDGNAFSGRWRAFLQSKSLGLKSTIFREWHDSRLFAWRHFVPMDNRYDDLYSLLTYFIGYAPQPEEEREDIAHRDLYIPRHEAVAQKIANAGREWANTVLRKEDVEVYMFRLLLEYGRIIDDNRDHIGYSGDGSEMQDFDSKFDTWW